ncbi:RNA-guided pseudouridylation complex pseudouridine synthase subunit Cbf5 [Halomicrobium sp. IBSBa]|uniref:RNA-guided pseudouridylation complex pseudouridine synthase subunit Cbf5 n=1 Tax=Halomicrobium sp. IBSBa TaxID=2778916 RepID=UPI001ABF7F75|nr:RNA-guided pseudouridylation complex pseudouridine synthase subunit Cbf5 [Halomicrobium sp. IBSBa]MBO4249264.1 RNA-guided pseudouridylation complex pseudouridine synthase subunit Cbf5 [Halomicrobium sp. IBSBa]
MVRDAPEHRSPADLLTFGVVNLDKPPGPSAHQVAAWVRDAVDDALDAAGDDRTLGRVAHGGTLDPKVTGCLPILLGDAARAARVFDDAVKEYVTILELHDQAPPDFDSIVAEFEGEIYQKPPRKSAVKRRLRSRTIHALDVLERHDRRALLRVRCGSGTYVRKLCHDIGLALGTGAHMGELRRTATGDFDDRDLVTMEDLVDALAEWADNDDEGWLHETVAPAEHALRGYPTVTIAPSAAREVAHGAPVYAPGVIETDAEQGAEVCCVTPDGAAVCLGRLVGDPDAEGGVAVELERVLV